MEKVFKIDAVAEYNAISGQETLHPLVTVIDFSKSKPWSWPADKDIACIKVNYGFAAHCQEQAAL